MTPSIKKTRAARMHDVCVYMTMDVPLCACLGALGDLINSQLEAHRTRT